ncbi:lipopolysaccharide 1,2-glucosyltransferase, partial [Escherichia coli]
MDSCPANVIDKVTDWYFRLANINTSECLNVAYGVDANYLDVIGVSIKSIVLNNRHINL